MAQDDAGAQEAYERELDEEEDIRRMAAEASQRRAQGAAHANANGAAGASSSAGPSGSAPGAQCSRCRRPCTVLRSERRTCRCSLHFQVNVNS